MRSEWLIDIIGIRREISWEIKNHNSGAELIVVGYLSGSPRIFKVSGDLVWSCDDFAVIGSGTYIAESTLSIRGQSSFTNLETTIYSVYEAKRMAENVLTVGKKTILFILRPGSGMTSLTDTGFKALNELMNQFAMKQVGSSDPLPEGSFESIQV